MDPSVKPKRKRKQGPPKIDDNLYILDHFKSIEENRQILVDDQNLMSSRERQNLRNKLSAQISRIRKREEQIFLHKVVKQKDEKIMSLLEIVIQHADPCQMEKIKKDCKLKWDDYEAVEIRTRRRKVEAEEEEVDESDSVKNWVRNQFMTKKEDLEYFRPS